MRAPSTPEDRFVFRRHAGAGLEAVAARFHGHAYDMHRHEDEWLLGVTHAGVQDFFCRGRRRQSTPGRAILIEPGERHDGRSLDPAGFAYSMLYLPAGWLRDEMGGDAALGFRETLARDGPLAGAIARACRDVLEGAPTLRVEAARDEMLARLRRHLGLRPAPVSASVSARGRDPDLAGRVMEHLRAAFREDVAMAEIAEAVGASSRFQMTRAFSARYGIAPHAMLVQLRLAEARRRLKAGEAPATVSAACGFADQSHLTRWFRRAYGLPPGAFARGRTPVQDRGAALG